MPALTGVGHGLDCGPSRCPVRGVEVLYLFRRFQAHIFCLWEKEPGEGDAEVHISYASDGGVGDACGEVCEDGEGWYGYFGVSVEEGLGFFVDLAAGAEEEGEGVSGWAGRSCCLFELGGAGDQAVTLDEGFEF